MLGRGLRILPPYALTVTRVFFQRDSIVGTGKKKKGVNNTAMDSSKANYDSFLLSSLSAQE